MHLAILRLASCLAPAAQRREWLAEWIAELCYVRDQRRNAATPFCLGAFRDALWLRRNDPDPHPRRVLRLESPVSCLLFLVVVAAFAMLLAFQMPGAREIDRRHVLAIQLGVVIALLILPAVTTFSLGEYPAKRRVRRWGFLVAKVSLILPIVFFGTLDVASVIAPHIQGHGLMIGCVVGFRWALVDQRQRCPVCLRLVNHPIRVGCSSNVLLDWYGTEFICTRGHGLLHVPEIPSSSYGPQWWIQLDGSWRGLFPDTSTKSAA
jgi:hypothetical protein